MLFFAEGVTMTKKLAKDMEKFANEEAKKQLKKDTEEGLEQEKRRIEIFENIDNLDENNTNHTFELDKPQIYDETTFIGIYEKYHNLRTNAPRSFATHFIIHLLGHAIGFNTVHLIQPNAVHHNGYLALLGTSGLSRKSTSQDIAENVYLEDAKLPKGFSPQGFLKALNERPHGILFMGEFSTLLRGIKGNSNTADFKEIANDLHRCPVVYQKKLVKSADSFWILNPYVSISTTCTPEEFFSNLTEESVFGGFLARFMLASGKSKYRPRAKLPEKTLLLESEIRKTIQKTYELFENTNVWFEFTKKGLKEFNKIDRELQENGYWHDVQPFVARYLDYLICYADMILLSDIIGKIGIEQYHNLNKLNDIYELNNLTTTLDTSPDTSPVEVNQVKCVNKVKSLKLLSCYVQREQSAFFEVGTEYVKRAWEIIKPCLEYTKQVTKYINEDLKVAKLEAVMEKHAPLKRSTVMRYTHLIKKDFEECIATLKDREVVFEIIIPSSSKQFRDLTVYCTRLNIDSNKCKNCLYKCVVEQRNPPLKAIKKRGSK